MNILRPEVVLYLESTAKFNVLGSGIGDSAEVNHTEAELRERSDFVICMLMLYKRIYFRWNQKTGYLQN